ncbi:MAG: hypothetical protein P8Y64_02050 [Gammaproteobacteria bacterium]|jgi:hypothetical protein
MVFIVANFTLAGVLFVIGILTLKKVSHVGELAFASLPLLFGLHQFTQGFVWLGLYHAVGPQTLHVASTLFVFYAQAVLPFLVPLAIWLLEPRGVRRQLIGVLLLLGGLLAVYVAWGLIQQPTQVFIRNYSLVYSNPTTSRLWVAFIYILTTCGALILSRSVAIQLFGWLNLFGLLAVYVIAQYSFTALWCLYAALVSAILYLHFIERRIAFLRALKQTQARLGSELEEGLEKELEKLIRLFPRLRRFFVNLV